MQTYAAGTAVSLTIPFEDLNGETLEPTALSWRLLNEAEEELLAPAALAFDAGATEITINVPANSNLLSVGNPTAFREIELTVTTANGVVIITEGYLLRSAIGLVLLKNSFQTYGEAQLISSTMHGLEGWATADKNARMNAMSEAFTRLIRLGYRVRWPIEHDVQSRLNMYEHEVIPPRMWQVMDLEQWKDYYPEAFRHALRRAQLVEANELLSVNVIESRRHAGLMSETIGESSMMFRSGKPLDFGLSAAALREVQGYVDIKLTMTRT